MTRDLLPITSENLDARTVDENFRRLFESVGGRILGPSLGRLAELVGGQYFEGAVSATEDSAFRHSLQRIPRMVVSLAGLNVVGTVSGLPTGGTNASWTDTFVYLRSSSTGNYAFLVI